MNINRPVIINQQNKNRFQSFIVFEVASPRINPSDILFTGEELVERIQSLTEYVWSQSSIEYMIIQNRLKKINQMLDLVNNYENIIVTKFLDKIWRRYSYISNLGELMIDLPTFETIFPEYKDSKDIIATRIDDTFDELLDDIDDNSSDDNATTENSSENETNEKSKTKESVSK